MAGQSIGRIVPPKRQAVLNHLRPIQTGVDGLILKHPCCDVVVCSRGALIRGPV